MCDRLSQATVSHKRPPIQNPQIFLVKALQLEAQANDHFLYATGTTFRGWRFYDFLLFLTACKRSRSSVVWSLCSLYVLCYLEYSKTTYNYIYQNFEITYHNIS